VSGEGFPVIKEKMFVSRKPEQSNRKDVLYQTSMRV
jgi:hypothetical protein